MICITVTVSLRSVLQLLSILLLVLCSYYSRVVFISLESRRHQRRLDKVCTIDTVSSVRPCQSYAQPLSSAVSRGNELYNTNYPSGSPLISSEIICIRCVTRILAVAAKATSIQRNTGYNWMSSAVECMICTSTCLP